MSINPKSAWSAIVQDAVYYGPLIVLSFGYGVLFGAKEQFEESDVSLLNHALLGFILIFLLGKIYRLRRPNKFKPDYNSQTIQDVDQAHNDGYRIWVPFPVDDDKKAEYLYRLRNEGYLVTDKYGRLTGYFSEFKDRTTRNRNRIKLVVDNTKDKQE